MKKNPTDYLITPDLNKPDEWTYPIDHAAITAMAKRVNRNHDETMQRLSGVINGRTVALLLNGASIKGLEECMEYFAHFDLCYMGINRFRPIEHAILNKGKRAFDIIFCMSEQDIPKRIEELERFLGRGQSNLLITTLSAMTWLDETTRNRVLDRYQDKLYLMPRLMCRPKYPISLEVIIDELVKADVKTLLLFGADGYWEPAMEGKTDEEIIRWSQPKMQATYYDHAMANEKGRATGVGVGTYRFNKNFKYEPDKIRIINCSPDSHYKHIPKMSYEQLLGELAVGGL